MFDDTTSKFVLPPFTLREKIACLLAVIGISITISGFAILWYKTNPPVLAKPLVTNTTETKESAVAIDISGAVKNPGIYLLPEGSRVSQVIELAGGFIDNADNMYIARTFNLAATVIDEQKIYIPFKGEGNDARSTETTQHSKESDLISINTASLEELETLEGVGVKRAEAIQAGRPYTALNELVTKKAISEALYQTIEKKIKI